MKNTLLVNVVFVFSLGARANVGLQGNWSTQCNSGLLKEQSFNQNQAIAVETFFADADCQQNSFQFTTKGFVNFDTNNENWVNYSYESITLAVFPPAIIEDFNTRKVCGFSDWSARAPQIITGRSCTLFNYSRETSIPKAGDLRFGIFELKDKELRFGQLTKELNSSTPAKRPTVLDSMVFKRVF